MRRFYFLSSLVIVSWLLVIANVASAYFPFPCVSGSSGLTRIPDAYVLPYKNWNLSTDFGTQYNGNQQQPAFYYKANLGAFHNFELGLVGGLDQAGNEIRDGVYVNMKYSPTLGDGSDPLLLAIGVENLASKLQAGVYMVASKPFKQGPILSFGFMADFPNGKFRPLGMAGLDIRLGNFSILSDLFAGESVFQLNGGVRFNLIPEFALEGRAINIFANQQAAQTATKDPKQYLIGFSWANPF